MTYINLEDTPDEIHQAVDTCAKEMVSVLNPIYKNHGGNVFFNSLVAAVADSLISVYQEEYVEQMAEHFSKMVVDSVNGRKSR